MVSHRLAAAIFERNARKVLRIDVA